MTSTISIGQIIKNRYRVDAFIDAGGMAKVYRVWDFVMNVPLAMKVLHADLTEDEMAYNFFQREARALKKLAHPQIVPFYGLDRTADFDYLLERFIDGLTLKQIMRRQAGRPLDVHETLIYLKAISAALGYAHNNDVVHCDVKPGNVMVDLGGNIYLTDFGIARHADSTKTIPVSSGTVGYAAPEQIRGEVVSAATDIYALGIMLYEMLTGQKPFRGKEGTGRTSSEDESIRIAHLTQPPSDPCQINPDIPQGLGWVLLKALEKNPRDRYPSTQVLLLQACAAVGITPDMLPDRLPPMSNEDVPKSFDPDPRPERRTVLGIPRRLFYIIVIGLFILLAAGFFARQIFFPNSEITDTPTSTKLAVVQVTTTKIPASPTQTIKLPTATHRLATSTPRQITRTPIPVEPRFTAAETMFCRAGPDVAYEAHTMVEEGTTVPVLARWISGNWLLVGINRTDTRTKCCWVGGEGDLNVNLQDIRSINFLPDRIECDLWP